MKGHNYSLVIRTLHEVARALSRTVFVAMAISSIPCWAQPDSERNSVLNRLIAEQQPRLVKVFGASVGRVEGYASGIIVSADGLIVTTQGVFLEGAQVRVVTSDGEAHAATVLKRDRTIQLALLKIDVATPDYYALSDQAVGQQGDWVVAMSNAFRVADKDEPLSAMLGMISLRTSIDARLNERDVAYRGELVLIDAITSN
ncbi:MAG TPA: trypsin-like peptidase domain-containing protein, partial [Pirellulaceae bacterium]|nr:trypsin-like peptidase domain-containing protein [Pirellulaceae bacterium]